ncbi:MAG: hypothetical protein ABR559_06135 [Gemmatimonadota bacterium]
MSAPLSRLRGGRLLRILGVYLAASWALLQVADLFVDNYGVPKWIMWAALLLLLVGLVVLIATALVQSRPVVTARADAEVVPHAWELDVGDLGRSLAQGRLPHLTWARAILGGAVAFLLLFGLAGLWVVIQDRGRSFTPGDAVAEDIAPGVAVLPFEASGPGLESWREGAIDLISTNLDGAAGLRAIDSRTVLARWSETVPEGTRPDLETALDVARATGAQYALLGNVVALGASIRLTADVHRVDNGRKLGTAQVEGAADSVYALVDRLSVEALRAIIGEPSGEFPRVELARATTTSLPALRAYLEGEALFRRADFLPALDAFQRAVAADSTFALAWRRLGESNSWLPPEERLVIDAYPPEQAARYADRLPEREAIAVRAFLAFSRGAVAPTLAPLRSATRRFPDDPELLFLLSEIYVHFGDQLLIDPAETDRTLQRVIALDPAFAPYYLHAIESAFHRADSARVHALLARYEALAGENREARTYRLAATLAWGAPAARAAAAAALDTLSAEALSVVVLRSPLFGAERSLVTRAAQRGGHLNAAIRGELAGGHLERARALIASDSLPARGAAILYQARTWGLPIDEELFRRQLAAMPDSLSAGWFLDGALAAEGGDLAQTAQVARRFWMFADSLRTEGDSLQAAQMRGRALAIEGYARSRQDPEAGLALLLEGQRASTGWLLMAETNDVQRLWIARILLDLDRPEEALPWLLSFPVSHPWLHSYALLEAAKVYERLGRRDEAKTSYETALAYWRNGDAGMQAKVAEARAGLARLGFRPRG